RPARILNSVGMEFALIPAGTFLMGSPETEEERKIDVPDEGPQHEVTLTRPFYAGVYQVTQRQYQAVMGDNPSYFREGGGGGPDPPLEMVTWEMPRDFCRRLSALPPGRTAGRVYRLPSEAEWEHACRAGTTSPFWWGARASSDEANFDGGHPYGGAARG